MAPNPCKHCGKDPCHCKLRPVVGVLPIYLRPNLMQLRWRA